MRTFTVSFAITDCEPMNDDRDLRSIRHIILDALDDLEYDFESPISVVENTDATDKKA